MGFPCPHCGSEKALTDRDANEIRPIIPLDLQVTFKEPPPPVRKSEYSYIPSRQFSEPPSHVIHVQRQYGSSSPVSSPSTTPSYISSSTTPPMPSPSYSKSSVMPPIPPSNCVNLEGISQTSLPIIEQNFKQNPPPVPPKLSVQIPKENPGTSIPINDISNQFKQIEAHFGKINSHQKRTMSQAKKFASIFKEFDKKLKKIEKSLNILLKSNKSLESIHKNTSKGLKKSKL
jgi:hypothetical protein